MAEITVTLIHGYKVGKETLKDAVLREVTAGDVIEAMEESEKIVMMPNESGQLEPQFVPSPTMVGVHVLRRQLKCIGNVSGPFDLAEIKRLYPVDLKLLQDKADELDSATDAKAAPQAVTQRGRSNSNGGAD